MSHHAKPFFYFASGKTLESIKLRRESAAFSVLFATASTELLAPNLEPPTYELETAELTSLAGKSTIITRHH